jgi:hypothetical protein
VLSARRATTWRKAGLPFPKDKLLLIETSPDAGREAVVWPSWPSSAWSASAPWTSSTAACRRRGRRFLVGHRARRQWPGALLDIERTIDYVRDAISAVIGS